MKNILKIFAFFSVLFSWSYGDNCQIINLKGAVVYNGECNQNGNELLTNQNISSDGIYLLKTANHKFPQRVQIKNNRVLLLKSVGSDSAFIQTNTISKILKREVSPSESYYLNTNFFAINGIGYKLRNDADKNFETLFSYVENDVQSLFPEDTIHTELVFNVTSEDIYTDVIQSLLLKAEELGLVGEYGVYLGYSFLLSAASLVAENLFEDSELAKKIIELAEYKDEIWEKIILSNYDTKLSLESVLTNSVQNKARAFVLGHSQGGMYTYKAFNSFPDSIQEHFYSLNVAVPTDKNPNWYLVNDNDKIINKLRIPFVNNIPDGESNSSIDGSDYGGESGHYHAWLDSYYNPKLKSYAKINNAIINAFRTVPYWEKEKKNAMYQLVWYNGAAQTTIEIAKADGSFVTLGTYHGYNVTDPTIKTVPNVLLQDGVPVLRVMSYHHESWWGPYLSTDPGFFEIISNDDGSLTYLMSDAWSPYSYDDAEFSITLFVE